VLERVGQRFLHDPVGGHVDAGRQCRHRPFDLKVDRQAGAPDAFDELGEALDSGLRRERRAFVRSALYPQQPAHLGQRVAPAALDRHEGLLGLVRLDADHPDAALGLYHHRADRVRHDVVQFPRDPSALLGHRRGRGALAVGVERRGVLLERGLPSAPAGDR